MEPKSQDEILAIYRKRTESLTRGDDSPVPLETRQAGFSGLEYFPFDPKYQFRLKLRKYETPEPVPILLSNGEEVHALRYGFLEFELDDRKFSLNVYKKRADDKEFFVPFKDKTSGNETYAAGRYVDIIVDPEEENCILDFHISGNPLCAFDEGKYACPIPPRENWLDVEIRAGEKKFAHKT
jgi:uncharacterized protein